MSARNPTYPGVYIMELPSAVRTITGVSTSITAFVGRAIKGPVNEATMIHSFGEFERIFGGLWKQSNMSYAIYQCFQNGGKDILVVRVVHQDAKATKFVISGEAAQPDEEEPAGPGEDEEPAGPGEDEEPAGPGEDEEPAGPGDGGEPAGPAEGGDGWKLHFVASNEGSWANSLSIEIDHDVDTDIGDDLIFNLTVKDTGTVPATMLETFRNVSTNVGSPRHVNRVLEEESDLIRGDLDINNKPYNEDIIHMADVKGKQSSIIVAGSEGSDGVELVNSDVKGKRDEKSGIYALENADLFNLLCIPPYTAATLDTHSEVYDNARTYCEERRAILLVDPPDSWDDKQDAVDNVDEVLTRSKNAAIFFPRIRAPDPLEESRLREFVPCGAVAGVIARTDSERGFWKSAAGIEATLSGVPDLAVRLTDLENGELNPLGVNCLRIFPVVGRVVWGARTMRGADRLADQWKYLAVRRTALYIEESLYRGTNWVVFEGNDEKLWSQIRLNVGAFMHDLFRKGAFQGTDPKKAYFVKCDSETTTQYDIDRGIVNIVVGFAPLKPAEFVILQIQQISGQEGE